MIYGVLNLSLWLKVTQIFRMIFVAICCLFSHIRFGRIIVVAVKVCEGKKYLRGNRVIYNLRLKAVII